LKQDEFISELALILGARADELMPETRFDSFSGWDSMGKMATITLIDTEVGLTVPYNLLEQCETLAQLLTFVAPRMADRSNASSDGNRPGASSNS
jgi:acyl carrier protein